MNPPESIVDLACIVAAKSPCMRSKRGAVLYAPQTLPHTDNGHTWTFSHAIQPLIFSAHNKPAIGTCAGTDECKSICSNVCVHAEQGALLQADCIQRERLEMLHVKVVASKLVPSGPPSCVECSKLMQAAGIAAVWLFHDSGWHRYTATEFHKETLRGLGYTV